MTICTYSLFMNNILLILTKPRAWLSADVCVCLFLCAQKTYRCWTTPPPTLAYTHHLKNIIFLIFD